MIVGDTGFDILLGGDGRDTLYGQNDGDIVIGGIYANETDIADLMAILTIWSDDGTTYADIDAKIAALPQLTTIGSDLPADELDQLTGGFGDDWLIAHGLDVTDIVNNESPADEDRLLSL